MSEMSPFGQLVGPVKVYIAPYGTAEPAINATPSGSWIEMGATDGEQSIEYAQEIERYSDNDHTSHVKVERSEEEVIVGFTLVNMTQEHFARVLHDVSKVMTTTSGGVNVKRMPFKRGASVTEYALLLKGQSDSPYGDFPGQNYIPRCFSDSAPTPTRGKGQRAELECSFVGLEDDNQANDDDRLGWQTVQIS